jgi:hypothetical protein
VEADARPLDAAVEANARPLGTRTLEDEPTRRAGSPSGRLGA